MVNTEKLATLKTLLGADASQYTDNALNVYLDFAGKQILSQLYCMSKIPSGADVPEKYEAIQIQATLVGINSMGAEGESTHKENGITRTYRYVDVVHYIKNNVVPMVGVIG